MSLSDAADDEAERQDELLSLEAIYSDDVAINQDTLTIEVQPPLFTPTPPSHTWIKTIR